MAIRDDLYSLRVASKYNYDIDNPMAFQSATCSYCDATQMAVVAYIGMARTAYLRCTNCMRPAHRYQDALFPASKPLRAPKGMPEDEARVWDEVRTSLQAGAYTGAVMLCRKLLFHVAVHHGLPPKIEGTDRAPSFFAALEHLQTEGIITRHMRPWVDRIKDVGNEMNRELDPIEPSVATDVATFTEQLLILAYEMPALQGEANPKT